MEITHRSCKPISKQSDSSRIYLPDKIKVMFEAIKQELINQTYNTDCYAIELLFKIGVRIGELVALCWKDIDWKNKEIHGRTKSRAIDNRIRKLCHKAGMEEKSAHDIRRTVASEETNNKIISSLKDFNVS